MEIKTKIKYIELLIPTVQLVAMKCSSAIMRSSALTGISKCKYVYIWKVTSYNFFDTIQLYNMIQSFPNTNHTYTCISTYLQRKYVKNNSVVSKLQVVIWGNRNFVARFILNGLFFLYFVTKIKTNLVRYADLLRIDPFYFHDNFKSESGQKSYKKDYRNV